MLNRLNRPSGAGSARTFARRWTPSSVNSVLAATAVAVLAVVLLAASAAQALTIDHVDRGAFVLPGAPVGTAPDGFKSAASPGSGDNYLVRAVNSGFPALGPPLETDRNYHTFDLSGLSGTITTATLRVWADVGAYDSSAAFETIGLFEVATASSVLDDPTSNPTAAAGVFNDLGTGTSYGTFDVTAADDASYVDVTLNAAAIAALNAAVGSGSWSVGGALQTIDGTYGGPISERVLKNDSSTASEPPAQLVFTGTVVPEPSTALLLFGGLAAMSRVGRGARDRA
ncbi:MAG: PEP-CTERM sorting domain-containing protein [Myxococcota bacterium]